MGKKFKMMKRCAVSNKVINGKEVVLVDYALDYVKMQGYVVVERKHLQNKAIAVMIMFLMVALVVMIPPISSALIPSNLTISVLTTDEQNLFLTINKTLSQVNNYCYDARAILSVPKLSIFGTEYQSGDNGTVFTQVLTSKGNTINNASCFISAYYPNKTLMWNNESLTFISNGIYYKDFIAEDITGIYMLSSTCTVTGNPTIDIKGAGEIHISNHLKNINNSIVNSINNIPSAVWNYTGTIASSIGDFFANKIWNYTNRNLTFYPIENNITVGEIWNYSNRNLTFFPSQIDMTNYNLINQGIWNYTDRNLTFFPAENPLTANNIWSYGTRELTYYPVVNLSLSNVSAQEITDKILCYIQQSKKQNNEEWNIEILSC